MEQTTRPKGSGVATLVDVAAASGVSTATVSRCLNTPGLVSGKTLKVVMDAVDRLGYSPNHSARALAAGRTNTIGAIIPTMENAIFARGIQAFQEELFANGRTLLVASSSYRQDLEWEQIRTLSLRGADALLLIGHQRSPEIYDYLQKRGVPAVLTWAANPNSSHLTVGFNNRTAMKSLADLVLANGHRLIGCISAVTATNDRARERVRGIRDAMADAGLDPGGLMLEETTYSIENGDIAFRKMMDRATRPTAVMCGNDVLAVGALRVAMDMGLGVPEDVSITGFDDIELASVAHVPLTTVRVPHRRMGRYAARALLAALEGEKPESVELPTTICMRATLGQAP